MRDTSAASSLCARLLAATTLHNQESCMPPNEGLAYISLPCCGSKLARSSAIPSTNSLLIPWLHCPSCKSCDKNVIMPLRGEMAGWKKAKPEASWAGTFPLSDVGLVKGEILALRAVSQWKSQLMSVLRMANDSTRSSAMSDVFIVLFTVLAHFWLFICKSEPIGYLPSDCRLHYLCVLAPNISLRPLQIFV